MLGRSRWERNSPGVLTVLWPRRLACTVPCTNKARAKAYNAVLARLQLPGSGACFYITRPRLTRIGHSTANNRINDHDLDLDRVASYTGFPARQAGARR